MGAEFSASLSSTVLFFLFLRLPCLPFSYLVCLCRRCVRLLSCCLRLIVRCRCVRLLFGRLFTLSLQSLLLRQRPVLIARTHLYQLGARAVRSPSRRPHDLLLPGDIVNPDRETLMDINEWGNVRRLQDWVGKTRWTRGSIVVAAAVREGFALFLSVIWAVLGD